MILTICRRLLLWRWNSSPAPNFGFYFQLEVLSEMRHQTSTCNVDLKLQLAIACEVLISKFNFKYEFKRSTSIFNLKFQCEVLISKFNFKFEFKRSTSNLIWNFNLKTWLEASIWNFNLQFQFDFLALDLRLDISSEHFSVRTKFVRTCEIEKIIIRAEIVRTKFVRTHVVHNVVQKRFQIEKRCPEQGIYLFMWMRSCAPFFCSNRIPPCDVRQGSSLSARDAVQRGCQFRSHVKECADEIRQLCARCLACERNSFARTAENLVHSDR